MASKEQTKCQNCSAYKELQKIIKWLDMLAADSAKQARETRLITIKEACEKDAANLKATAGKCRKALEEVSDAK